jgi:hypothetical protein
MSNLPITKWIPLGAALRLLEEAGIDEQVLFAAGREGRARMQGAKEKGGNPEHSIPASYFNTARRACGAERSTLEIGPEVAQETFLAARRNPEQSGHPTWHCVQVRRTDVDALLNGENVGAAIDAFGEASWNLDQALIWVVGRNPAAVADASDAVPARRLTWLIYEKGYYDREAEHRKFLGHLQRGAITVRTELNEVVDPGWFQHATIHINGDFSISLQRTDLDAERFDTLGGGAISRRYIRSFNARFSPSQLRAAFPGAPADFSETPFDERDEPWISFADTARWRAVALVSNGTTIDLPAIETARRELIKLCKNERLHLYAYHRDAPGKLAVIPPERLEALNVSLAGGQPDTELERERGPRHYGSAWREDGPLDEWTGLCFRKVELRTFYSTVQTAEPLIPLPRPPEPENEVEQHAKGERQQATIRENDVFVALLANRSALLPHRPTFAEEESFLRTKFRGDLRDVRGFVQRFRKRQPGKIGRPSKKTSPAET